MLYKDILFNNQGIKEVRCADEVIWKKKISQLLQLMDVTGKSEARVNEICVRGKNIYAYIYKEYGKKSIAKIANENGNLRIVNTVDILSASDVFVCDPKLDGIIYVVGRINSNSQIFQLLCVDVNTGEVRVAYSANLLLSSGYGYNNKGFVFSDFYSLYYFEYNKNRTDISSSAQVSVYSYKIDKNNPLGCYDFSKNYTDDPIWFLSSVYNSDTGLVQGVAELRIGSSYGNNIEPFLKCNTPYNLADLNNFVEDIFCYKKNDQVVNYAFISKDGKLFVLDDYTLDTLNDKNKTLYQKQNCYRIKLDIGSFIVSKCKYDRKSNLLFVRPKKTVYENGKRIGFKVFKIDTKSNTATLLKSYESDQEDNYFGFDVDGTDVYVGCNENINGKTFASILHEQLSVPTSTSSVIPDNGSTLKPKYQWDIKDTTTYVKSVKTNEGEEVYQIKDDLIDNKKNSVFVFVSDRVQIGKVNIGLYEDTGKNFYKNDLSEDFYRIYSANKFITFTLSAGKFQGTFYNLGAYSPMDDASGMMYYFEVDYSLESDDNQDKFKNEIKAWVETI